MRPLLIVEGKGKKIVCGGERRICFVRGRYEARNEDFAFKKNWLFIHSGTSIFEYRMEYSNIYSNIQLENLNLISHTFECEVMFEYRNVIFEYLILIFEYLFEYKDAGGAYSNSYSNTRMLEVNVVF
jgi:hypothetical protein